MIATCMWPANQAIKPQAKQGARGRLFYFCHTCHIEWVWSISLSSAQAQDFHTTAKVYNTARSRATVYDRSIVYSAWRPEISIDHFSQVVKSYSRTETESDHQSGYHHNQRVGSKIM